MKQWISVRWVKKCAAKDIHKTLKLWVLPYMAEKKEREKGRRVREERRQGGKEKFVFADVIKVLGSTDYLGCSGGP